MQSEKSNGPIFGKMDILRAGKTLKTKIVDIPEWGGSVIVREMTGVERDKFDEWVMSSKDRKGFRTRMIVYTAVDEDGKLLFSDLDIPDLQKKSGDILMRISDAALDVCGMSEDSHEENLKNSEAALKEDSSSVSA